MTIIEITHTREIPCNSWHGYVSEPSPEAAIEAHRERYGDVPDNIYFKREKSGKCAVYIPVGDCEGDEK